MDTGSVLTWGFVLTAVSVAVILAVRIARWLNAREREEGERRWELVRLIADIEVRQRRTDTASRQLAELAHDTALLASVTALYSQVAEIDPAAVNIPPLFLADWLEDRGISAEPLREYARRWPDGVAAVKGGGAKETV